MEALQQLPNISRLSQRIIRVLGQNPGKFTLQGTNTYLIGQKPPFILVDTGEGLPSYIPVLEEALRDNGFVVRGGNQPPPLSDIIITHHHHDHFGGLSGVLQLTKRLWDEWECGSSPYHDESQEPERGSMVYVPPKVHKFVAPLVESFTAGPSQRIENEKKLAAMMSSLTPGTFSPFSASEMLHPLTHLQCLRTADGDSTLSVIHTPGHTPDSVCLLLHEDKCLFSADSVLGQGTAVFENLGAYMTSLRNIDRLRSEKGADWEYKWIYPGHGPAIEDGPEQVKTYIAHRQQREEQILKVLESMPPDAETSDDRKDWTIGQMVSVIYKAYPERLWEPAAHGVRQHLSILLAENRVKYLGGEGMLSSWILTSKL